MCRVDLLTGLLAFSIALLTAPPAMGASRVLDEADCNDNGIPDSEELRPRFSHLLSLSESGAPAVADFDGDSDPDPMVADSWRKRGILALALNSDGNGNFSPPRDIAARGNPYTALVTGDFNGDSSIDVMYGGSRYVNWYPNSGGAHFGRVKIDWNFSEGGFRSLLAADFDGDLDLDVISVPSGKPLHLLRNRDGAGTFRPPEVLTITGNASRAAAGDIDGDLDVDLLVSSTTGLAWHENLDAAGTFGPPRSVTTLQYSSLTAADLDGDGDPDVLAARDWNPPGIFWHENLDGAGTYGPAIAITTDNSGRFVSASDLDADGDLDVVSASDPHWYENLDGLGDFAEGQLLFSTPRLYRLVAADLDGDGDPDIVSGPNVWRNEIADCNRNSVPDDCDIASGVLRDCDADGIPDDCDGNCNPGVASTACDSDCDGNRIPDACEVACVECDSDLDGCLDEVDEAPLDPNSCGDSEPDGCDDCTGGFYDPAADGSDVDADGFCDVGDCVDDDPTVWGEHSPSQGLTAWFWPFPFRLDWSPPAESGGQTVTYDVLRSISPGDFLAPAICVAANTPATSVTDPEFPFPGIGFHYLVRSRSACPEGTGNLGAGTDGIPRLGLDCDPAH